MNTDWSWARLVDWDDAFKREEDEPDVDWLVEGFLQRGSQSAIYGDMKVGKSLLIQDIAAALATGRSVLGLPPVPPVPVLYLDWENHLRNDVVPRMRDMGLGPDDLKGREVPGQPGQRLGGLRYASFPEIPHMDTPEGGRKACELAYATQAALIVVDTTTRIIGGATNSPDTFTDLYNCTLMPLKRAGHTVVRIDHEGKDPSRGMIGANAKAADVDTVWHMTEIQAETVFQLHAEYHRSPHISDLRIRRQGGSQRAEPGPLVHVIETTALTPVQRDLAAALDNAGIPRGAGRDAAGKAVRAAGIKARTEDLAAVVRYRKNFQDGQPILTKPVPAGSVAQPVPDSAGQPGHTQPDLVGQQLGQVGQRTWDRSPSLGGDSPVPAYDFEADGSEWAIRYRQARRRAGKTGGLRTRPDEGAPA